MLGKNAAASGSARISHERAGFGCPLSPYPSTAPAGQATGELVGAGGDAKLWNEREEYVDQLKFR